MLTPWFSSFYFCQIWTNIPCYQPDKALHCNYVYSYYLRPVSSVVFPLTCCFVFVQFHTLPRPPADTHIFIPNWLKKAFKFFAVLFYWVIVEFACIKFFQTILSVIWGFSSLKLSRHRKPATPFPRILHELQTRPRPTTRPVRPHEHVHLPH